MQGTIAAGQAQGEEIISPKNMISLTNDAMVYLINTYGEKQVLIKSSVRHGF